MTTVEKFNTNADLRSHAKKVLDNIQAVLENKIYRSIAFSIAGRSSRMLLMNCLHLEMIQREYLQEIKEARIKINKDRVIQLRSNFNWYDRFTRKPKKKHHISENIMVLTRDYFQIFYKLLSRMNR